MKNRNRPCLIRRRLVIGAALCFSAPRMALAQKRMPLVGVILAPAIPNRFMETLRNGLRELGYVEGKTARIEWRSAGGRPERFPVLARELVQLKPDVIVAGGGSPAVRAAMDATADIPIVFPASGDPVGDGLVQSLARPGGNVTGTSILTDEMNAKRVELLRELRPGIKRAALLLDPKLRSSYDQLSAAQQAAKALGIVLEVLRPGGPEEYAAAFEEAKRRAEVLIVLPSSSFNAHRRELISLADRHGLITMWEHREFTMAGGLASYGPDFGEMYRVTARKVARILEGAKPGDLPIEQATKLELVINLRTAKAQKLTIPHALLLRADQVIR
ncbi:MAG: ABC transporter substrate-binding protein [Burkholderiales bacterium]